jgi:hypothetical protein
MKVLFKNLINGYTGIQDDCVLYYSRRYNRVIIRHRPRYQNHPRHSQFALIMKNLKALQPAQLYKDDLRTYCTRSNLQRHSYDNAVSWSNIWQKLLWTLARINPQVDLQTITREQIYQQSLPCISVKSAVEAGLLPPVQGYIELTAEM